MGTTIGDYVHYQARNYVIWGTNHVGEIGSSGADANTLFIAQQKKVETSMRAIQNMAMSPDERLSLEQRLMNLMRPPQDNTASMYNELWNALVPYFESEFEDGVGQIARETANVFAKATIPNLSKVRSKKDYTHIMISTIMSRVSAIYEAFIQAAQGSTEKRFLQQTLNKIDDAFSQIAEIGRQNLAAAGIRSDLIMSANKITLESAQPVIDLLNKAAAAASGTVNLQKGTLFEDMIAIAPYLGKNLTQEALQNAIKESVVGTTGKSSVTFDPNIFTDKADLGAVLGTNYQYDVNSQLWKSINQSQDKVDVKLDWRGDGSKILISAKNVNLGTYAKGVHLVSSMSLLSALVALNNIDLVNHYLNLNSSTYKGGFNFLSGSIYNNCKMALNFSILEQAFRGYKGTEKAEVFVINDNQTGAVKVFDIPTLILKAIDQNDFSSGLVEIDPDLQNVTFANYWASSYQIRITNLLKSVNAYKLNVTLRPSFFAS